ncbi:MAG: ribonuclease P protein component [Calditrichaeota bacterium]|nr:ribonuclease P protein component [Calditrichota bacterium]
MNLSRRHNIVSINKSWEIKQVLDKSRKLYHKYGIVFLNKDDEVKEKLRAAVIVKKNCGRAVRRNYIKRIGRYFICKNITLFKNYNRVIFLFLSKEMFKYKDLDKELKRVFSNENAGTVNN